MSSFYTDASLVMIPSGYKDQKVYCAKPVDGSADLTFSRSNDTATRVGPDGLIEKVRTNLLQQSNSFDTTWGLTDATVTSGATDPNGGTTAWTLANTAASGIIQQSATLTGLRSVSIYAKAGTHRYLYMGVYGGTNSYQNFDLQDGVVSSGANGRIESVGGGWYRCTSFGADGTTGGVQILASNNSSGAGTTNGNILIWNCQYETGDIATDYIATTTAAVSVGPVANLPRLDYLNSSCPRLLLEPQRTNNAQYSEQLDNAWYIKNNQSVTANDTTAPDGYSSADLLIPAAGTGDHYILSDTVSSTASQVVTLSLFIKKKDHDYFYFGSGGASAFGAVVYQFSTNTFTVSGLSATATNYGNGWIRLTITGTTTATDLRMLFTPTDATGSRTFNANGTDGTWVWGMQAETASAYATSYIPTLGAAVTRGADAASKTGISSLIGQTEGTLYAEIVRTQSTAADTFWITLSDGTINNWLFIGTEATGGRMYIRASNTVVFDQYPAISVGTHKIALAYKSGSIAVYIDGAQIFTSAATYTIGSLTGFALGQSQSSLTASVDTAGAVNQALLFKTRLSNDSLASLTSL